MSCSPVKVSRHIGGKYGLNLQGRGVSEAADQHEARSTEIME
jgi:hypothetical protein